MKIDSTTTDNNLLARSVAPEDLNRGDYVAVLSEVVELPSFYWCESVLSQRGELVRLRCLPTGNKLPLKVQAICLPFVFVKSPLGQGESIDIRQVQLARMDKRYAKTVWKHLRQQQALLNGCGSAT